MAHIRWEKGGTADVTLAADDRVELASSIPSAPGSRIDGALESGTKIRVKVARCLRRERPEGGEPAAIVFVIEGRLIDAARPVRSEVGALVSSASGSG